MNSIVGPTTKVERSILDNTPSTSYASPSTSSIKTSKHLPLSPKLDVEEKRPPREYDNSTVIPPGTHPEEFLNRQWEIDHIQYCNFNPVTSRLNDSLSINTLDQRRMKTGAAYRAVSDKDTSEYKCFRDEKNEMFRIGDFIFLDVDSSYPYVIGKVESFRMKKGSQMTVKVSRLYRREDLLQDSLSLLEAERLEAGIYETNEGIRVRELFPSDAHLTQSVAVIKGKCQIVHLSIKNALQEGQLDKSLFFYCTGYSPDTGRLNACQAEIREGEKFQAVCPELNDSVIGDEPDRDQLVYKPGNMCADAEEAVMKYARSYRTLVLLDNPQINELERTAFQGDRVKIDALDCLTRCGYVAADAVKQMMVDDKVFIEHSQFLSSDDTKKFVKGLRNYGKNFQKIIKEYLPTFSRDSLVNYYYWWKKSNDAFKPKKVNGTVPKKTLFPQPKRPQRTNTDPILVDYDSLSEDEEFDYQRACHHCYGLESKDWHHSGPNNQLLCTSCRHYYKVYGIMQNVIRPKELPRPLLHDESLNGGDEGDEGVKTRASNRRGDRLKTPIIDEDRTPTKNGVDLDSDRRSTPQRSVKINKRTYHPSTSSTEETTTPKKSKDSKMHKVKSVHQPITTNRNIKNDKQESSVDSDLDDQQICAKTPSTSTDDSKKIIKDEQSSENSDEPDSPLEIRNDHRLRLASFEVLNKPIVDCFLHRRKETDSDTLDACSRTQFVFKCANEARMQELRKGLAEHKQRLRREEQSKAQAEMEKQRVDQEREMQLRQLQQVKGMPMGLQRPPGDIVHPGMRLSVVPPNSMFRPSMPPIAPPELIALAANRPELMQALVLQHSQTQQQVPRPQMMMPPFGGHVGLPPSLNPLLQGPMAANALIFQQMQAAHQARMLEEQRRQQQQLEQREREHRQMLQNQQLLMAMNFTPQMLSAAAGFPLNLPTSASSSQQLQQPQPQAMNSMSQLDQATQLLRTLAGNPAVFQQQQQANQYSQEQQLMQQLYQNFAKQEQQRGQPK